MSLSLNNNLQTLKVGDYFWSSSYTIDTMFDIVDEIDYTNKEKYRWTMNDLAQKQITR